MALSLTRKFVFAGLALLGAGCLPAARAASAGASGSGARPAKAAAGSEAIRRFRIHVPDAALVDLRQRGEATRWAERETVSGPSQGVQLATIRHAWDQLGFFYKKGLGYANEMALRPQTLFGIADSPTGLAAWMLDRSLR
jgi:hypothetical protein